MSTALPVMLLTSLVLHVLGLMAFATFGGALRTPPTPSLLVTELLVPPVAAEPLMPAEPVAPPEPDTIAQPAALPEPPEPPKIEPPKIEPPKVEPITPPKLVAKPMPQRVAVQPKPAPPVSRRPLAEPRAAAEREPSPPGPPLPSSAASASPGNVLGPAAERAPASTPPPVEGGEAGAGKLFERGDVGVVPGAGAGGGSGGPGRAGLGSGGPGAGGGTRVAGIPSGDGVGSGLARPLGGYQVKPRYPETARRQGMEGTTLLKVYVSERGLVDDVLVERSAGSRDLDVAAMEAVKQWRFEPARQGQRAVAIWVMLPVRFTLK